MESLPNYSTKPNIISGVAYGIPAGTNYVVPVGFVLESYGPDFTIEGNLIVHGILEVLD